MRSIVFDSFLAVPLVVVLQIRPLQRLRTKELLVNENHLNVSV